MYRKRRKGLPVDKRGKIENPVQSFDLLRSSDSIEAAQVLTMDRVGSNAESEIIFMTRINLILWAVRVHLHLPNAVKVQICSRPIRIAVIFFLVATTRVQIKSIVE